MGVNVPVVDAGAAEVGVALVEDVGVGEDVAVDVGTVDAAGVVVDAGVGVEVVGDVAGEAGVDDWLACTPYSPCVNEELNVCCDV